MILPDLEPILPSRIEVGQRVLHIPAEKEGPCYGIGLVRQEWGSWWTCRHCHNELVPAAVLHPSKGFDCMDRLWPSEKEIIDTECKKCGVTSYPINVSGRGIFDVLFGKEEHSIHERLLKPL